nr:AMP-dependent synthetase and ligase [uncultured bacterium]
MPILTEEEERRLLVEWNETASEYPRSLCLHELFEEQARRRPDAVAVVHGAEQVTYRELNERANRLAHYLRARGVGPETPVAVLLNRSLDLIVGLLGILKAGGAYVPLDAEYPQERLGWMLDDSAARVLLSETQLLARLPEHSARVVCLDTDSRLVAAESARNPAPNTFADNLAYVMYTSARPGARRAWGSRSGPWRGSSSKRTTRASRPTKSSSSTRPSRSTPRPSRCGALC